jgi:hypothetical protein
VTARWSIVALAAGAAASAATAVLLSAAGGATFSGLPLGLLLAPLLLGAASPAVRALLCTGAGLVAVGAAWTLVPLLDHHVTGAIAIDGALPDLVHHVAGWAALVAGSLRLQRPGRSLPTS